MNISPKTKVCMVIGNPVGHSLSPQMHTAGYKALGIDNKFIFTTYNLKIDKISDFIKEVRLKNIRGISCTMPYKTEIIKFLDKIDGTAKKIGAVNTVVNDNGKLTGYNTDWLGAIAPLEKMMSLKNKKVALVGAGGTARAIAFGVAKSGAYLTIFNRSVKKAEGLAHEFKGDAFSLNHLGRLEQMDIIFNATPVGMYPKDDESLIPKKLILSKHLVFDVVYVPYETKLLRDAKERGARIIHGSEMFLQQGIAQFKLYTGYEAPEKVMLQFLLEQFNKK